MFLRNDRVIAASLSRRRILTAEWCQTACKPGSVQTLRPGTTIPLGRALLRASRDQPGRRDGNVPASSAWDFAPHRPPAAPIRSCSRWGLPCRPRYRGRGALLPHRFTLARGGFPCAGGLFSVALSLGSPPPAVSRHRIPVEPGLSSTGGVNPAAAVRPSGVAVMRIGGDGVNQEHRLPVSVSLRVMPAKTRYPGVCRVFSEFRYDNVTKWTQYGRHSSRGQIRTGRSSFRVSASVRP